MKPCTKTTPRLVGALAARLRRRRSAERGARPPRSAGPRLAARRTIVAVVALLACARPAAAQTEQELEAARATFAEGVQLAGEERYDEAASRFRSVIEVRDTPPVRYNLALALSHTEAIAESARLLDSVLSDPETAEGIRGQARELLDELEPRLGRLTVQVAGEGPGVTVELDGEPLGFERLGVPLWVAAGTHRLVLRRDGEPAGGRTVDVQAGGREQVLLVSSPAEATPAEPEPLDQGGEDVTSQGWFWALVAGGAALVAGGVVVGVVVASDGSVQAPVAGNLQPGVLVID